MNDERGEQASPPPPLRGMIDPTLHRPLPPSAPEPDPPVGPDPASRPPSRADSRDLVLDDQDSRLGDDGGDDGGDELRLEAPPTGLVRLARVARAHPGRALAVVIALALVLSTVITVQVLLRNRRETFSQSQVMGAMTTFRPPSSSSSIRAVGPEAGTEPGSESVTVSPVECNPLVSLRPAGVIGGAEWLDISGPTYDSTQLQILRFTSPRVARTTLRSLADSLARCGSVSISYAQGGDPEVQTITPDAASSEDARFGYRTDVVGSFYYDVRQFGNTIIWVYGSGASSRDVRTGAATDLVEQLQRIAGG